MLQLPRFRCWLCKKKSIYTCPSCETNSCSLECCQTHKKIAECDGEFSDFVDMKDYDTSHLKADLQKLDYIKQKQDNSLGYLKKNFCYKNFTKNQILLFKEYEKHSSKLLFMPHYSQRSQKNISTPDTIYIEVIYQETLMKSSVQWTDKTLLILSQFNEQYNTKFDTLFLQLEGSKFQSIQVELNQDLGEFLADIVIYEYPIFSVCKIGKLGIKEELFDEWVDEWEWQIVQ